MELVDPSGKLIQQPRSEEIPEELKFIEDFDFLIKDTVEKTLDRLNLEHPELNLKSNIDLQMQVFQQTSQAYFQKLMVFLYKDSPIEDLREIFTPEFQELLKKSFTINKPVKSGTSIQQ